MRTRLNHCEIALGPEAGTLTGQQKAIILFLGMGMSNKAIAKAMGKSPETIKTHVEALFLAFGVNSRLSLVAQAFCHHILIPAGKALPMLLLGLILNFPPSQSIETKRDPVRREASARTKTREGSAIAAFLASHTGAAS
ncbi:MAG: hypothetical protein CL583_01900 [Alteromonadaceae bacterium]|nr:hypothetical protein [Alteromonadaceae bacterium]|tara:strand:+ start:2201 stop:2617 length:417 start_codon:yes stop_codon:yes gene_type:complete